MRNTKLILAMLAGCTVLSGAAFAQDASQNATPTPASNAGSQTQSRDSSMSNGSSNSSNGSMSNGSMSNGSMSNGSSMSSGSSSSGMGNENGSMKSTHKKGHHKSKTGATGTEPAKSSSSGM